MLLLLPCIRPAASRQACLMIACAVLSPTQRVHTHTGGSVAEQDPACCQPGAGVAVHARMSLKSCLKRPAIEMISVSLAPLIRKPHLDGPHLKIKSSCFGIAMVFLPSIVRPAALPVPTGSVLQPSRCRAERGKSSVD